jgi:hypothetical protein
VQINWLSYQRDHARVLAIVNSGVSERVTVDWADFRNATVKALTTTGGEHWHEEA